MDTAFYNYKIKLFYNIFYKGEMKIFILSVQYLADFIYLCMKSYD